MQRDDIFYECYGVDDQGRTGVFRSSDVSSITRYAKRGISDGRSFEIVKIKVVDVISSKQLTLFDELKKLEKKKTKNKNNELQFIQTSLFDDEVLV